MLCPPPPTLNPVTIFEAARLPHRANSSRAAGSFFVKSFGRQQAYESPRRTNPRAPGRAMGI